MNEYYVHVRDADDENRDDQTKTIAHAVINASEREVDEIEVLGLIKEQSDKEALNIIIENTDQKPRLKVKKSHFEGVVSGTSENIEAVIAMFSDPLIKARFRDKSSGRIFDRADTDRVRFFLTDEEFNQAKTQLTEAELQLIEGESEEYQEITS